MTIQESGAVLAVFEDLGGFGALARQEGGEGPLVNHLQRANIQLASIPVFVARGLAETTVNDLLAAAGVSRRTFYKYFDGKLDVLEGIYRTAVQLLLMRFREMRTVAGSSEAWLRAMVGRFFDYHQAVGPIIRLMHEEALRSDSPLAAHRREALAGLQTLLEERFLGEGVRHPALTYQALLWAMEAASHELLGGTARPDLAEVKRVLGDLLVNSLCARTT
ncbi:TetR/AcrR family transcriptional regulator [Pseudomonas citronellolis]|uniref:TetR/AcrR family transcriptional regulator n=1 Tax=Pseudomonas citronellolis TaxID=53408 RepID=UPI0023E3662C|nr:TetR/AcrR family transcriptional regulator [Pseudomonas citronellolis]MDF3936150.1 TetR/AcrR family transcriptional regulator [Pseudomonas citronellolis]